MCFNPLTPVVSKVTRSLHKLMGIHMYMGGDLILGIILQYMVYVSVSGFSQVVKS